MRFLDTVQFISCDNVFSDERRCACKSDAVNILSKLNYLVSFAIPVHSLRECFTKLVPCQFYVYLKRCFHDCQLEDR